MAPSRCRSSWRGLIFNVLSRLLIVEGFINDMAEDPRDRILARSYYEWIGRRFVLLFRVPLPLPMGGPPFWYERRSAPAALP
jgi:hypothetical protein